MTKLGSQKLQFCSKVTEMGSVIGHRTDYNGVGGSKRPAAHTQQKLTQVAPRGSVYVGELISNGLGYF